MAKKEKDKRRLTHHQVTFLSLVGVAAICAIGFLFFDRVLPKIQGKLAGVGPANQMGLSICKKNLHEVASALDAYAEDHDGKLPPNQSYLIPHYLPGLPTCPTSKRKSYRTEFGAWNSSGEEFYKVTCAGGYHAGGTTRIPGRYPAVHSHHGYQTGPSRGGSKSGGE